MNADITGCLLMHAVKNGEVKFKITYGIWVTERHLPVSDVASRLDRLVRDGLIRIAPQSGWVFVTTAGEEHLALNGAGT